MRSPHLSMAWCALRALRPRVIVESGVYLGLGTWFFEQACPEAELHCIEPDLERVRYRSPRATYYTSDFTTLDWTALPREETLLFFDDHQNAVERVRVAQRLGFKHLLFEDNYPAARGDCYSLKKAFMHAGFTPEAPSRGALGKVLRGVRGLLGKSTQPSGVVPPGPLDAQALRQSLDAYFEFPPVFRPPETRWGDPWEPPRYPGPEPLLETVDAPWQQVYRDEAVHYTWMCYARLK